jgi:hypothetical protein
MRFNPACGQLDPGFEIGRRAENMAQRVQRIRMGNFPNATAGDKCRIERVLMKWEKE